MAELDQEQLPYETEVDKFVSVLLVGVRLLMFVIAAVLITSLVLAALAFAKTGPDGPIGPTGPEGPQGEVGPKGQGAHALARVTAPGNFLVNQGFASATRESTGQYRYVFTQPVPGATYIPIGQVLEVPQTSDRNLLISDITATGFLLTVASGDNGTGPDVPVDADHCLTVHVAS